MTVDTIRDQSYVYFRTEAQDLLQTIEQGVLNLKENRTKAGVHELMRAAHTLKGAAASVELDAIKTVAHLLEDVFKALYDPDVVIDAELESLLFAGYECLRLLLTAELIGRQVDESEILNRAATVIAQLQTKLGDRFGQDAPLPTSAELGFDMVQSMFEIGVTQRLEILRQALSEPPVQLEATLRTQADVFNGLAESLSLPGFAEIARTTLMALDRCPDQVAQIAQLAYADFSQGRTAVLAGDRTSGGAPSLALQQLASGHVQPPNVPPTEATTEAAIEPPLAPESVTIPQAAAPSAFAPAANAMNQPVDLVLPQPNRSPLMNLLLTEIHPEQWLYWCVQQLTAAAAHVSAWAGTPRSSERSGRSGAAAATADALDRTDRAVRSPTSSPLRSSRTDPAVATMPSSSLSPLSPWQEAELNVRQPEEYKLPLPSIDRASALSWELPRELPSELSLDQLFSSVELEDATKQKFSETETENCVEVEHAKSQEEADISHREANSALLASSGSQQKANLTTASADQAALPVVPAVASYSLPVERVAVSPRSAAVDSTPVRVNLAQLERLNHLAGELLINQNQQSVETEKLHSMVQDLLLRLRHHQQSLYELRDWSDRFLIEQRQKDNKLAANSRISGNYAAGSPANMLSQFDALEMDRYGDLHFFVQTTLNQGLELETVTEMVAQAAQFSRHTLEMQQRLLTHMRDDLTAARMQPLDELLRRFSQVLKQLSAAYQKPVELVLSGTQVLVDKSVVEKLYDPLLHLVRNAFDHGIESSEIRRANGKPERGTIEIKAYHRGNRTLIQVKDDGQGIDLQRIAQRAIELRLISLEQVEELSISQLLSLMFEPGFSTASQLSELSGRGIGLDVVRSQLQALNGSVSVDFTPQVGTTFSLSIPLSITITKLLVCQSGDLTYAFPVDNVEQVIIPDADQLKVFDRQQRLLHWRNGNEELAIAVRSFSELIPSGDAKARFSSLPSPVADYSHNSQSPQYSQYIVLLNSQSGLIGLQVDQVLGEQELVIRPLGPAIVPPPFVYGCCILTNSQLALAIDVESLTQKTAQPALMQRQQTAISSASQASSTFRPEVHLPSLHLHAPHILLVDDSLTLRQTLTLTLQKAGYQVSQAQDGLDALQFLRQHSSIELIICDVEMPRLNGFEFLSQLRQDRLLPNVPVVMLTSRSSAKYRQLALELGATGYLTKPYTDKELLATVSHLLAADLQAALSH